MRRMSCVCLLILLLPTSGLDDVLAALTPDPSDDIQVASSSESNVVSGQQKRPRALRVPGWGADRAQFTSFPPSAGQSGAQCAFLLPPVRPGLLYLLMSFQC
jgi:hypothetical protein